MTAVGVVFGGLSPEHDISILTGLQAARLLEQGGREAVCLYWTRAGTWLRVPPDLEGTDFLGPEIRGAAAVTLRIPEGFSERRRLKEVSIQVDVILNCCHGGPGEDGTLVGLLSLTGIAVTGPTHEAAAWSMDKLASAGLVPLARLDRFGIEAIPTVPVAGNRTRVDFAPPWVVKPRFAGSSIGVEVGVEDLDTVLALSNTGASRSGAVVQPQLTGWSDLNMAVRAFPELECSAIERPLTSGPVYGYSEKYLAGAGGMESAKRELPANIPVEVAERVTLAGRALVDVMQLSGTPRIDFLYDGGSRLAFCEINAIPGSLALYLWAAAGVDRKRVVEDLIEEAIQKGGGSPPHWTSATDRSALRAADSVAAKLR